MRPVLLSLFIILLLSFTVSKAIAAESGEETKRVTPQTTVNYIKLPADPQERAKAIAGMFSSTSPGGGSAFMFKTSFIPSKPEQSSLRPAIVLNYQASPPYTIQGYFMSLDPYGYRVLNSETKVMNNQATQVQTLLTSGNTIYQWYQENNKSPISEIIPNKYMEVDGTGARYFLNSVRYKGVLLGPRMEQLLKDTDARRIGVENIRGTRTIVYGIQPTKQDFINGIRYLQIWVRNGDFKLIRTNLDLTFGREFTEYSQHLQGVSFKDAYRFLKPNETWDQMMQDYNSLLGSDSTKVLFEQKNSQGAGKTK